MSHYVVLVTDADEKPLDEQLAPFDENREVPAHIGRTVQDMILAGRKHKEWITQKVAEGEKPDVYWEKYLKAQTDEELYRAERDEDCSYDSEGNELTTYNPDSKWDWYTIGGRWDGFFTLKNGERCNEARKRDIDLAGMLESEKKDREDWWNNAWATRDKTFCAQCEWAISPLKKPQPYIYRPMLDCSKEEYINQAEGFSAFAYLDKGVWNEEGEMGWWGMVNNKKEENLWEKELMDWFNSLPDDTLLTAVDCHI